MGNENVAVKRVYERQINGWERECSGQTCARASCKWMGNENVAAKRVYERHVNG